MKRFLAATETVAAVFLLIVALLTAGNVLLRDVFSIQIPDWFDFSKLFLAIALFWGIAIATYHAGHICVDIVWEHLGEPNRRRMDIAASVATLAFLAPMAWMVWTKVATMGTQATTDLRLPLVWFFAVGAAGAVAAVVLGVLRTFELITGRKHADGP